MAIKPNLPFAGMEVFEIVDELDIVSSTVNVVHNLGHGDVCDNNM